MNEPSPNEESLRHFLLGRVDDAERQKIERLFLTDAESKERLLAAEQSLIDDYLEERLPAQDKESFLSQYAAFPNQRRKLRIAKSIKEHAEAHGTVTSIDASLNSRRPGWLGLQARPQLIWRIAAILIVAVIVAVWFQSRRNGPDAEHLAREREIASLNNPSRLRETLPQMSTLSVAPITLRTVESQAQFTPRVDIRVLELHLVLIPNEHHVKYRAVLRGGVDSEQFNFPELPVQDDNPGLIRLRIPTSLLSRGAYQVILSGIADDGTVSSVEEYNFTVGG
jgi:hypothetical protein